jgi:hypothetical protein
MSSFEKFEGQTFKQAADKFNTLGPLGVTAADHLGIGSTPKELLINNPGKTLGELMTDDEISQWINGQQEQIAQYSLDQYKDNSFVKSILPKLIEDLRLSKEYLKSIDRLPSEQDRD